MSKEGMMTEKTVDVITAARGIANRVKKIPPGQREAVLQFVLRIVESESKLNGDADPRQEDLF